MAIDAAGSDAEHSYQVGVPVHLRDTSYHGAGTLGNGKGYKYPHDFPGHYTPQQYMPDNLVGRQYYKPSSEGGRSTYCRG